MTASFDTLILISDAFTTLYQLCDLSKDGKLSMEEITQPTCMDVGSQLFGMIPTNVKMVFDETDSNKDGLITMTEAAAAFNTRWNRLAGGEL